MSFVDYPDFQRVDQWVGDPFVSNVNVNGNDFSAYGPFFASAWESISIFAAAAPAFPHRIQGFVQWYADQAMTTLIGQTNFTTLASLPYSDVLAVLGPWCYIQVAWGSGFPMIPTTLVVLPRRSSRGWARSIADSTLATWYGLSVLAGATSTQFVSPSTTGRAHLHCASNAAIWSATIVPVDGFGVAFAELVQVGGRVTGVDTDADFVLPAQPCVVQLTNGDAAARVFNGAVVLDTSW